MILYVVLMIEIPRRDPSGLVREMSLLVLVSGSVSRLDHRWWIAVVMSSRLSSCLAIDGWIPSGPTAAEFRSLFKAC